MQGAAVFDQNGRRKYLNSLERRTYLQIIGRETDARRRAFCLTLYYCGCRIAEIPAAEIRQQLAQLGFH